MKELPSSLSLLMTLKKIENMLSRTFDSRLGGLSFNEFIILLHLLLAPEGKLRRIDLAQLLGVTAAAVTRVLLPMEKVGYVRKDVNPEDARVSFVLLAPGGKRRLQETIERAKLLAEEILPGMSEEKVLDLDIVLQKISNTLEEL